MDPEDPNTVLYGFSDGTVYMTENGGESFRKIVEGIPPGRWRPRARGGRQRVGLDRLDCVEQVGFALIGFRCGQPRLLAARIGEAALLAQPIVVGLPVDVDAFGDGIGRARYPRLEHRFQLPAKLVAQERFERGIPGQGRPLTPPLPWRET